MLFKWTAAGSVPMAQGLKLALRAPSLQTNMFVQHQTAVLSDSVEQGWFHASPPPTEAASKEGYSAAADGGISALLPPMSLSAAERGHCRLGHVECGATQSAELQPGPGCLFYNGQLCDNVRPLKKAVAQEGCCT